MAPDDYKPLKLYKLAPISPDIFRFACIPSTTSSAVIGPGTFRLALERITWKTTLIGHDERSSHRRITKFQSNANDHAGHFETAQNNLTLGSIWQIRLSSGVARSAEAEFMHKFWSRRKGFTIYRLANMISIVFNLIVLKTSFSYVFFLLNLQPSCSKLGPLNYLITPLQENDISHKARSRPGDEKHWNTFQDSDDFFSVICGQNLLLMHFYGIVCMALELGHATY